MYLNALPISFFFLNFMCMGVLPAMYVYAPFVCLLTGVSGLLNLELVIRVASEPQGYSCLGLTNAGITRAYCLD